MNRNEISKITPPEKSFTNRGKWIKRWHAFGLFFAVSNTRLKKRDTRPYAGGWKVYHEDRSAVFEAQGHRCAICGREFETHKAMEAHHALPWHRFPELRNRRENIVMLCHRCHKEVHCNPYKEIAMMEAKASELGINISERFSHGGAVESGQECALMMSNGSTVPAYG